MKKLIILLFLLGPLIAFSQKVTLPNVEIQKSIRETGDCTPSTLSTNTNNFAIDDGCHIYKLSASAPVTLSGIAAKSNGYKIELHNTSTFPITIPNESSSSDEANRFVIAGQGDIVMGQYSVVHARYDGDLNRWLILSSSASASQGITAPETQALFTFAIPGGYIRVTGQTSAQANVSTGSAANSGAIVVVAQGSISLSPTDNVFYSANTTFGSGDDIGGGTYVVYDHPQDGGFIPSTQLFNISGLTAGTEYSIATFSYISQGSLISYNTTISDANLKTFTTHPSEDTPTEFYTIESILTKEDSIIIYGTAGNGTNRAVLMAENKEVDSFFVDDQSYTADDFGQGDEVGTGNYVVANTTDESPLRLAGFERDKAYSNPYIAEYTSGKYLLPPANAPPDFPNLLRTAWVYKENFSETSSSDGQNYLESDSRLYYDFTALTGGNGATITTGNLGLEDYSTGSVTGVPLSSPKVKNAIINSTTVAGLNAATTSSIDTESDGSAWLQSDFELWLGVQLDDGQVGGNGFWVAGATSSDFSNICRLYIGGTGDIIFRYATGGGNFVWTSNPVFPNGPNAHKVMRVVCNFTTDTFQIYVDDELVTGSFTTGNISGVTPTAFASDRDFVVGNVRTSDGLFQNNPEGLSITRFAITDLTDSGEEDDLWAFFGSGITSEADFIAHETVGFDYEVTANDSLRIYGTPFGYQDYLIYRHSFPDSLHEFTAEITFKVNAAIDSDSRGIGIGVFNDLDNEANRGAYGLLVMTEGSADRGKVQMYAGTGASDPTAFAWRSQSSGAFIPEIDSVYTLKYSRDIEGENVFHSITVVDGYYDSLQLSTGWLEVGGASSTYIGNSAKAVIYMNGGDFVISNFTIRRLGSETSTGPDPDPDPPPTPGAVTYEVWVTKEGNDSNNCTENLPCLTIGRGANRGAELGPGTDMFIGPGTYVSSTVIDWSTALDTIDGAGPGVTIIKGASNLNYPITNGSNLFNTQGYLWRFNSGSSTDDHTVIRNIAFEGDQVGAPTTTNSASKKGAIYINNRDLIQLHNVRIEDFNTCGIWATNVDSLVVKDAQFFDNGFSHPGGGITWSHGHIQLFGRTTKVWVRNCLFSSPSANRGMGIQHSGSPNFFRFDVHVHRNTFNIGPGAEADGHHFAMEFLYIYFNSGDSISVQNNLINQGLSINMTTAQGTAAQWGKVFIHGNTWNYNPSQNLTVEAQMHNAEICHNTVINARGKVFGTYNQWGSTCPRDCDSDDQVWKNLSIHHNIIEVHQGPSYIDGIFGDARWRRDNVDIYQNTVVFMTTSGSRYIVVQNGNQGTSNDWVVENNAFYGQPSSSPSATTMWGASTLTNSISRYNKATHLNVNQTKSGVSVSNNAVTGAGNSLGFNLSGAKPFPFYAWPSGNTVLRNAGQGGADIGAYND